MIRDGKFRLVPLATLLMGGVAMFAGCEQKGPAQKAGESIDKGVQDAKDAVTQPGPGEKAGRALDGATK